MLNRAAPIQYTTHPARCLQKTRRNKVKKGAKKKERQTRNATNL